LEGIGLTITVVESPPLPMRSL